MPKDLIVDDTDPSITYNGPWTLIGPLTTTSNEFNSTLHRGNMVGQSLTYTFTGIGIQVYGTLDTPATKGLPGVQFQVDNNPVQRLNSSTTPLTYNLGQITTHQVLFQANNLNFGEHTITISMTDTNGPFFYFDFFTVQTGIDSVAGRVILDDKDSSINYVPQWSNPGVPDEFLGGTSQSPSIGSFATVEFNGTEVYVYGTTDNRQAGGAAQIGFELDGLPGQQFNAPDPNSAPLFHNLFFSKVGLANTNHTLKIEVLNDRPWFLDYVVYTTQNSSAIGGGSGTGNANKNGSTGAIVGGIAAGVVVLLGLAALAFFLLRRRRQRRNGLGRSFSVMTHKRGESPDMTQALSVTPYILPNSYPSQSQSQSQSEAQYQYQSSYKSVPPAKGGFSNPSYPSLAYQSTIDGISSIGDSSSSAYNDPRHTSRTQFQPVSENPMSVTNSTYIPPIPTGTGTGTGTSIVRGSSYRKSDEKRRRRDTDPSSAPPSQYMPQSPSSNHSHSHSHSHSNSHSHSHSNSHSYSQSLPQSPGVPIPPIPIEVDSGRRFRPVSTGQGVPRAAPPVYTAD